MQFHKIPGLSRFVGKLSPCGFLALSMFASQEAFAGPENNGPRWLHTFTKQQLTDQFWSEGAAFGDFNRDGKMDVVAGPFWYEGPAFTVRHAFMAADKTSTSKKDGKDVTFPGFKGALGSENDYS